MVDSEGKTLPMILDYKFSGEIKDTLVNWTVGCPMLGGKLLKAKVTPGQETFKTIDDWARCTSKIHVNNSRWDLGNT